MPDEIKIDGEKFDRILGRMLNSKPLSKEEISAKIQTDKEARRAKAFEKYKERRKARKQEQ
jgi:hypothetical protein